MSIIHDKQLAVARYKHTTLYPKYTVCCQRPLLSTIYRIAINSKGRDRPLRDQSSFICHGLARLDLLVSVVVAADEDSAIIKDVVSQVQTKDDNKLAEEEKEENTSQRSLIWALTCRTNYVHNQPRQQRNNDNNNCIRQWLLLLLLLLASCRRPLGTTKSTTTNNRHSSWP